MKILVTGACGFAGHHFVEHIYKNTDAEIIAFDKLTYAANGFDRLFDMYDINCFDGKRMRTLVIDFSLPIPIGVLKETRGITHIVHMGAETHVDRSIIDPGPFVISNVVGTMHMLDYARQLPSLKRFVMFSTDEVFGPAPDGIYFKETDPHHPKNPYAATKSAAEKLCEAYANCYKLPILVTHCMNIMGERQHPEKFIPLVINKVLKEERLYIHAHPDLIRAGARSYIHARNVADAVLFLLRQEKASDFDEYNITGEREIDNLSLAKMIAEIIGKPLDYEMVSWQSSRPGHDLRYGLDGSKLAALGWRPPKSFEESLRKTVEWTLAHPRWLEFSEAT
jgi:dTDP-glucose 4,6-dehydratase